MFQAIQKCFLLILAIIVIVWELENKKIKKILLHIYTLIQFLGNKGV